MHRGICECVFSWSFQIHLSHKSTFRWKCEWMNNSKRMCRFKWVITNDAQNNDDNNDGVDDDDDRPLSINACVNELALSKVLKQPKNKENIFMKTELIVQANTSTSKPTLHTMFFSGFCFLPLARLRKTLLPHTHTQQLPSCCSVNLSHLFNEPVWIECK